MREFFSNIYCEKLLGLLVIKPTKDWVPLEFVTLSVVHTECPAIDQLQFRFSHPGPGSCGCFGSLYLPVCHSNLGGSGLPCVLSLLGILKELLVSQSVQAGCLLVAAALPG